MRLWHIDMIEVLPNKMLISQWRECIAIKRQWERGTLNHKLVNYVKDYNKMTFFWYVNKICNEMKSRNIKFQTKFFEEIKEFCYANVLCYYNYPQHNDDYLRQCYYNLEEKFNREIITNEEFEKIKNYDLIKKIMEVK